MFSSPRCVECCCCCCRRQELQVGRTVVGLGGQKGRKKRKKSKQIKAGYRAVLPPRSRSLENPLEIVLLTSGVFRARPPRPLAYRRRVVAVTTTSRAVPYLPASTRAFNAPRIAGPPVPGKGIRYGSLFVPCGRSFSGIRSCKDSGRS